MAKLTYLQLTNRVLSLIDDGELSSGVSSAANNSKAKIISNFINQAQNKLFTDEDWYSLYATRTFATVADTTEYAIPSDFGRNINLINTTSNWLLQEDFIRSIDASDPDADTTGAPRWYTIQADNYRLYPIPDGAYTIRERYWKIPTTLSADGDQSDLPIECENAIIWYTVAKMKRYLGIFNEVDRYELDFEKELLNAKRKNTKRINQMLQFQTSTLDTRFPLHPPTVTTIFT